MRAVYLHLNKILKTIAHNADIPTIDDESTLDISAKLGRVLGLLITKNLAKCEYCEKYGPNCGVCKGVGWVKRCG